MLRPPMTQEDKIREIDEKYQEVAKGQNANIVFKLFMPALERRLGDLISKFGVCPPELGPLLDLRAQIAEVWKLKQILEQAKLSGLSAERTIETLLGNVQKTDKQPQ